MAGNKHSVPIFTSQSHAHMRTTTTRPPVTKGLSVTRRNTRGFVSSQTMRGRVVYITHEKR